MPRNYDKIRRKIAGKPTEEERANWDLKDDVLKVCDYAESFFPITGFKERAEIRMRIERIKRSMQ